MISYFYELWLRLTVDEYWSVLDYDSGREVCFVDKQKGLEYAIKTKADLCLNFWSPDYGWVYQTEDAVEKRDNH